MVPELLTEAEQLVRYVVSVGRPENGRTSLGGVPTQHLLRNYFFQFFLFKRKNRHCAGELCEISISSFDDIMCFINICYELNSFSQRTSYLFNFPLH